MSARIAPEPISSGFSAVGDYRSRTVSGDARHAQEQPAGNAAQQQSIPFPVTETATAILPPMIPAPPAPAGAAFAMALLSSQLPPRPASEREIQRRMGSAELPAQGSLALHDRRV